MSELKPCPFCGGRSIMDASSDLNGHMEYRVECAKVYCFAHGPTRKTEAEAVAAWECPSTTLAAAVQGEREACAKIAEEIPCCAIGDDRCVASSEIGATIRARGPAPAVDVMAVVREYVEAMDDCSGVCDEGGHTRYDHALDALRALVDGKGESKDGGAE